MPNRLSKKISILLKEGIPKKQAIAIALSMQKYGRIGPKGEYIKKKRRSPKKKRRSPKKKRRSPKKKRRSPKKKRRSPKKKRRSPKKKRRSPKKKYRMACGGCGCGDYDDIKLRNMGKRYKNLTGRYPASWGPCKSCKKCIVKGYRKLLNKERLQFLKEDCSACAHQNCQYFIKYRQMQRKLGMSGKNPWTDDCNRAVVRAEKVKKY